MQKTVQVLFLILWPCILLRSPACGGDVLTYHNDKGRTGLQPDEFGLVVNTVNSTQFGEIFHVTVAGQVYAQPLYVSSVPINGKRHNLLIIATELDNVYAFDADIGGAPLWMTSLVPSGETPADSNNCGNLAPSNGITSTPVVDLEIGATGRIFVLAMTKTTSGGKYVERLHSLDVASGQDQLTKVISGTFPGTFPSKDVSGGKVNWNPAEERGRVSLLLTGGTLYTAWASFCDHAPYAGWVIAYDESTFTQLGTLDDNPTATGVNNPSTLPDGSGGGFGELGVPWRQIRPTSFAPRVMGPGTGARPLEIRF
jgi:hypothetical protein